MKTSCKKLSTSVTFTVEYHSNDFEPARLKALERLAHDLKVPGFRNGRAPANVVEQHVDPNELASQTLDIMVRRTIPKLFDNEKLIPISVPHVEIRKFVPGESAEVAISADIMPEVTLGDYEHLPVTYSTSTVKDSDIEDVLLRLSENYATPKVVKRAAKNGDEVIIDFVGKHGGKAFKGGSAKDYHLRLGSGQFIPGFEDGIIGHLAGDKFDLSVTFPADYASAELAGQPAVFEILVKQVNALTPMAIDDKLAEKSGAFKTLDELRADIRKNLTAQTARRSDEHYKNALIDALVARSKTDLPLSLVEEQLANIRKDLQQNLASRQQTLEQYLKQSKQKLEDFEKELRSSAEQRVRSSLIVQKLSDALGIDVSEEDASRQIAEMRAVFKKDENAVRQLDDPRVKNNIRNRMRIDRTLDKLAEINKKNAPKPKSSKTTKPTKAKKATKKP